MTFVETNKAVVRRFYAEAWNQKKLEILEETHAPDWTHIDPSNPADLSGGPEANRARLSQLIAAFPDIHYTLEDVIAEGGQGGSALYRHRHASGRFCWNSGDGQAGGDARHHYPSLTGWQNH